MRILSGSRQLGAGHGPFAVAIGIFDGVHLGHRVLLERAVALARTDRIGSLAYTFNPHPAKVLAPGIAPKLLEPVERRLERFEALGVESALVEPFDLELAAMAPDQFVTGVLVNKLRARHVVVGDDFSFGHKGAGRVPLLQQLGERHGFVVHAIAPVTVDGERVSSSRIRELLQQGDVARAALLLGRPHTLSGRVMRGAGRGATIGVPTANLETWNELLPATGVYATRTSGPFGTTPSVTNIGVNPTFEGKSLRVETHLLDYSGVALYGAQLEVELVARLREERKFASVDELKKQIFLDIAEARRRL